MNNKASNIACRAELGRYLLIFDIIKRILNYISYLQSKEQSSLVIQSLLMSIDFHSNRKTNYASLIKMLNYYNIPFNFNHDNLDNTKILHFVAGSICGRNILPTGNIPFAIHKSLNLGF